MKHPARAAFVSLEGIDGAGKTSHLASMAAWIRAQGHALLQTREPGGTPLGEQLRALVLHQEMCAQTEALLMFAARNEHLETVIRPALARGEWVLSDRFADASIAYQGGGRGLGVARIEALEAWTLGDFRPDLTLLLDLDPQIAAQRMRAGRAELDRFEHQQTRFFEQVRAAYLQRAAADRQRIVVVDATRPLEEVAATILTALAALQSSLQS